MKKLSVCIGILLVMSGCSTTPPTPENRVVLQSEVVEAISIFKKVYPEIKYYFEQSAGYAVFPKVFKGALVAGGAYGRGEVFDKTGKIGYCSMSQATVGASLGGEYFREIIFFQDEYDLEKFKYNDFVFSAQMTAVAAKEGSAVKADYTEGTRVFIVADSGLMVDVSVGGQQFSFVPLPRTTKSKGSQYSESDVP